MKKYMKPALEQHMCTAKNTILSMSLKNEEGNHEHLSGRYEENGFNDLFEQENPWKRK